MLKIATPILMLAVLASCLLVPAASSNISLPIHPPHGSRISASLLGVRVDTAINISFVLQPGERIAPPDNRTPYYHTRVLAKSALMGEVRVEGSPIYFTANGYNAWHMENILINQSYSFVVDPADDLYWFIFDNTAGDTQSLVRFELRERYTTIPFVGVTAITAAAVFAAASLAGVALKRRRREMIHNQHQPPSC